MVKSNSFGRKRNVPPYNEDSPRLENVTNAERTDAEGESGNVDKPESDTNHANGEQKRANNFWNHTTGIHQSGTNGEDNS